MRAAAQARPRCRSRPFPRRGFRPSSSRTCLEDMVYLTVLDVGAHMPPRIEIPEIVSMRDAEIVEALDEAERARREATRQLTAFKQAHLQSQNGHGTGCTARTGMPATGGRGGE